MRKDLQKVLCTRPRFRGYGGKGRAYANEKYIRNLHKNPCLIYNVDDDGEYIESNASNNLFMSKRGKHFSDLLAPLKGWARKSIGRPYNKAKQELLKHLNGNGVLHQHVLQHADDFIIPPNDVEIINGAAFRAAHLRGNYRSIDSYKIEYGELYVDPRDGIVKFGKGEFNGRSRRLGLRSPKRKHIKKKQLKEIKLPNGEKLKKENDIWFHVRYGEEVRIFDPISYSYVKRKREIKKQLSKKELKKHKLVNFEIQYV